MVISRRVALFSSGLTAVAASVFLAPAAQAVEDAPYCHDTAAAGAFSVSCGMSGTCVSISQCYIEVACTLTFTGVGDGSCDGKAMICSPVSCSYAGSGRWIPAGYNWWAYCDGDGVSLSPVALTCWT